MGFIVKVWDLNTLKSTFLRDKLTQCLNTTVLYSPDGRTLAAGNLCGSEILLWNMNIERQTAIVTLRKDGLGHGVKAMAFFGDSKNLITVGEDNQIKFWNIATGKHTSTLETNEDIRHATFTSDGKILATISDGRARAGARQDALEIRDLAAGNEPVTLKKYSDGATTSFMRFSPDGKILALGQDNGTIKLWDVGNDKAIATLSGHTGRVESLAFSADGKMLASGSEDKTVKIWDAAKSK
jgi:WD40 repeat protein